MLALIGTAGLICLYVGADTPAAKDQPQSLFNAHVGRGDWPQLGGTPNRNNTPDGVNIPTEWDTKTGKNIKWSAKLGSQTYGNIVVANGNVYVGTNNNAAYLNRYSAQVDVSVLLCFRESDGEFLWQYSSEKLPTGRVHDWPLQGICSAPVVEGERLWFVTNRGEVVCLDAKGFYDEEDDGPVTGIFSPIFDVVFDLSKFPEFSKQGEPAQAKYELTLKSIVQGLDSKVGDWYFFKPTAQPNLRAATSHADQRTLFQVSLADDSISITGLNDSDKEIRINANLLDGLNEGRLSPGLRLLFASKGIEITEEAKPTVVQADKSWLLTANVKGTPTTFRLLKGTSSLVCERQIAPISKTEADVVWSFNMMKELGVRQHNMATCAPTIWGDVLFICTSNGVDEGHVNIPAPDAPSFMAMDKHTGKVLWTDNSPGKNILHGQWSCPAVGVFAGVPQVLFPGGDGWLYSFRADRWKDGKPELLWKFDGNPKDSMYLLGGRATRNRIIAIPVIYDGLVYLAMGEDPEHGEGEGHLWCIDPTKRGDVSPELVVDQKGNSVPHRRLKAFDQWETVFNTTGEESIWNLLDKVLLPAAVRTEFATAGIKLPELVNVTQITQGTEWQIETDVAGEKKDFALQRRWPGSIVKGAGTTLWCGKPTTEKVIANPNTAAIWHYDKYDQNSNGKIEFEETMHRTLGSPAIKNNLLFITDFSGLVHCLDAKTGKPHWTCDLLAACWTTPLIVGEKVYVADEDGDVAIFSLSANLSKSVKNANPKSGAVHEPLLMRSATSTRSRCARLTSASSAPMPSRRTRPPCSTTCRITSRPRMRSG